MKKLQPRDLLALDDYARERTGFRERISEHRHTRSTELGPHMTLFFEDRWTIQYQVQERLRDQGIVDEETITTELAAWNRLIPDGHNWKATCVMACRATDLADGAAPSDLAQRVWVRIGDAPAVYARADEGAQPGNGEDGTGTAVFFLRFALSHAEIADLNHGARVDIGVDHATYQHRVTAPERLRQALAADLSHAEVDH